MKPADLRSMSDEQLALTRKDTIKHLFQLNFQSATDRLETPSEIRKAKRDVAKINTITRERELQKLEALNDEQLKQKLVEVKASIRALEVPSEVRQARRHAARLEGMLRKREAAKKTKAAPAKK